MSILYNYFNSGNFKKRGNMNQTRQKLVHAASNFDTKEALPICCVDVHP